MYLSQLHLNPRDDLARADMSNPYELHRTIRTQGFRNHNGKLGRVLFRLEPFARRNDPAGVVLVQSIDRPDWSPLTARGAYLLCEPQVKEIRSLDLQPGQVLRFRLRANPSKRDAKTRKRISLIKLEDRLAWLERKGKQCGFWMDPASINCRELSFGQFWIGKSQDETAEVAQANKVTIYVADFDGILQVIDPTRLLRAVEEGIGPAKGFGCGLLSLARA